MYDVTWYIVDDNKGGSCPPSDNSGKIFVTVRRWTTDLQHAQPTDDDLEDFMQFLDKYVGHAVGRDRKKLNSGVRVKWVVKSTELVKFKLATFLKIKS